MCYAPTLVPYTLINLKNIYRPPSSPSPQVLVHPLGNGGAVLGLRNAAQGGESAGPKEEVFNEEQIEEGCKLCGRL